MKIERVGVEQKGDMIFFLPFGVVSFKEGGLRKVSWTDVGECEKSGVEWSGDG